MRIAEFNLYDHPQLGTLNINFDSSTLDVGQFPGISIIIGANGTGKSLLLRALADAIMIVSKSIEQSEVNLKKRICNFDLVILANREKVTYKYDGISVESSPNSDTNNSVFFKNLIVCANTIYDKFYVKDSRLIRLNRNDERRNGIYSGVNYNYMGIKSNNNLATTTTHIYRTIDYIFQSYLKNESHSVINIFEYLKFDSKIEISYRFTQLSNEFRNNVNRSSLESIFSKENPYKARLNIRYWESIKNDDLLIDTILRYLNSLNSADLFDSKFRAKSLHLNINLKDNTDKSDEIDQLTAIAALRKLDILKYSNVSVRKHNSSTFDLRQASSGELGFLTSFLSIASVIKENSIIIIDEPEISLHPTWQMKYLEKLYSLFETSKSCQFIIATHSHFLVSDLRPEDSSLLVSKLDEDKIIEFVQYPRSSFGHSAEDILYNIFGLATTRNFYFESDLRDLASLVSSKSDNIEKISEIIGRIEKFKFEDNDPLHIMISQAKEYVRNVIS